MPSLGLENAELGGSKLKSGNRFSGPNCELGPSWLLLHQGLCLDVF